MAEQAGRKFSISEQPHVETILAAVLAVAHGVFATGWADPWSKIDEATAQVIYQTGAGVVAVIASLAALGLATGGAGERAQAMRKLYGPVLRRNWRALLLTAAAAPMLAITAQIAAASGAGWAPYLFEAALAWTALRLARLAWLVDRLLGIQIKDETEAPPVPQLPLSPEFQQRMRSVGGSS